jgi:phosphotransferase system enzyme I (PtsI)
MGHSHTGTSASDGLFMGPVRWLSEKPLQRRNAATPAVERNALQQAILHAASNIETLIGTVEGEAQDILAFQLALLEDDALSASAWAAIDAGQAADQAWAYALNSEITGYETSDDEYFRARSADLADIRDRVLRHLAGEGPGSLAKGAVLVGEDLAPSLFLETDWSAGGGVVLTGGSHTSHVAMLARARGIPMVVGLTHPISKDCRTLIVDGTSGTVIADPDGNEITIFSSDLARQASIRAHEERFLHEPARRRNGARIEILVNVAGVDELDHIDPHTCDGIGLMRSEFLFRDGAALPDEDTQYLAYRRFLEWAGDKPVTIRTLDIGGDKPIQGLTPEGEKNPFLGLRGVRLTLAREALFRTQLRALARAAVHGNLKIMIPMVTIPEELTRSADLLGNCVEELHSQGIPHGHPPLGIMVEVPAVAVAPELFAQSRFFSIGSNDLTQYVTASSRDDARVATLNDPSHPAVLRLIEQVAHYGRSASIPVSLCGDMASEPHHLDALLKAGLTSLSVAPARLARIKAMIAEL